MENSFYIKQTHSTNALLWEMIRKNALPEGFVVHTDFQTAGKGQLGNSWESATAKNLLFSMVLYPQRVPVDELFLLSQLVSVAIKRTLEEYIGDLSVKWPNDIYWKNKKIAGILIENSLQGNKIKSIVIGIGLNVNQKTFVSDAPNPVSLLQIVGKSVNRKRLIRKICKNILALYNELNAENIRLEYAKILYRKDDFYSYKAKNETFQARIISVHADGQLDLEKESGEREGFYFKEVQFEM